MKVITTRVARISYNSSSRIAHIHLLEGADVREKDVQENIAATTALTQGRHFLKLIEDNANVRISKEARILSTRNSNECTIAVALVVRSVPSKLIANFYMSFSKPKVPTRIFSTKEKASEWLAGFLYLTEMPSTRKQLVPEEKYAI